MSVRHSAHPDAAVEAAIAQVLAAERSAREAIAQARIDAAAITDEARAGARAIVQRTERRMQRVRAAYDEATRAALDDIAAAVAAIPARARSSAEDRERLAVAVAALAARLTGGSP